jgi:EAL domain-containing protein (putative c-di-GMP-specific phosphodiesterase class I)
VAEGVETVEQLRKLQAMGCDEIQGYLLSKPVPPEDIPELMRRPFFEEAGEA